MPSKTSPGIIYNQINELNKAAEEYEEATEQDISEFLEEPDNIILSFGQNLMGYSRNEIKNLVEKNINKYKDDNNLYLDLHY